MSTDMTRLGTTPTAGPAMAGEMTADTGRVAEVTADTSAGRGAAATGRGARPGWWRRMWQQLLPTPDAELVLGQLTRQLAVLEGARAELETGWVQGGWWSVSAGDGTARLITGPAAAGGHPDRIDGSCLVGALVRAGSQRSATSSDAARSDVGRAVDAVYDALWTSRGQPDSRPPGTLPPMPPPDVRLARVRTLTQWNDQAGRSREDVVAVVDRAISATIMDLMAAPRPAQARAPAGVLIG